jgi:hypothetical protein
MTTRKREIARYLATGEVDDYHRAWPGDLFERARLARVELRGALVAEVRRRAGARAASHRDDVDVAALARRKVEPMVRGLFHRAECETVLATLERAAVFLTAANIEHVLTHTQYDRTAWTLANLYLRSTGADLLSPDAPDLVGLSEHTTFYVSAEYLDEDHPFADFVVHEAAHVFHNCKRRTLGLHATRRREWLLDIAFGKRETFAYACEAYARIVERSPRLAPRELLAEEYRHDRGTPDVDGVDRDELVDIVRGAATARNGWKRILARCAPPPAPTRAEWLRSLMADPLGPVSTS